jgi:hypothetical protein
MLTADVRVEGFDASDWLLLRDLLAETEHGHGPGPTGGVVVLVGGGRVLKLISTSRGRLDPSGLVWPSPLGEVAEAHGARWALRIDRGALPALADRFAGSLARTDDALGQALKLATIVRELAALDLIESHPRELKNLPVPGERMAVRALDAVCPVGKVMLLGAFDGAHVATAIALHRGTRGFDRVVGPVRVRGELGLVSGDWFRDARGLARAVELSVGPLSLGCFAQVGTFRRLLGERTPGAWASAVAAREILLHPIAPAVAIPLGLDVGRAAVVVARGLAARLGVASWLGPESPFRPAFERVREAASHGEIERILGFDPLAVLTEILRGLR